MPLIDGQLTLTVNNCSDCPFFSRNSDFPETTCGAAKRTWGMGYYQGGPSPAWCPMRTADVLVQLKGARRTPTSNPSRSETSR